MQINLESDGEKMRASCWPPLDRIGHLLRVTLPQRQLCHLRQSVHMIQELRQVVTMGVSACFRRAMSRWIKEGATVVSTYPVRENRDKR